MASFQEIETDLIESIDMKDVDKVKQIIRKNPDLNLNYIDKDELTPLQHACHAGNIEIVKLLIDNGANVNYTNRKDKYTNLMFAAISNKQDIVKLLLEKGVDINVENCVNRTASQMAAFVGLSKIVYIINSWIAYEKSVEPYTRQRELETAPRIPSQNLGRLLHEYIVLPSIHPVKFFQFIKDNLHMIKYGTSFMYVLESLCSKSSKPPNLDEVLSFKYHFVSYILKHCLDQYKTKISTNEVQGKEFNELACVQAIDAITRQFVRRKSPGEIQPITPHMNRFILDCAMKYPYTHLGIFKTTIVAMNNGCDYFQVITQSLNGPSSFGRAADACSICTEVDKCRKCSKCKSVYYCGPQCQLDDWFQHKKVCKSPDEEPLVIHTSDNQDDDS